MVSRHTRIVNKVQTRLKFRQLRLLVAVGQHQNIQGAARELNVSQPAASSGLLPQAIDQLMRERPHVAVKVVEGTNDSLMPSLRRGAIDMVVGRLPTHRHRDEIAQSKLFDETIVAVTGPDHPLAGQSGLNFVDLMPYGWILPPPETSLRRQVDMFFGGQGMYAPASYVESVSFLTNRSLLQRRPLICLMPRHVPEQDIAWGSLAKLDWQVPFGAGPVGISLNAKARLSPAAKALIGYLEQAAAGQS